MPIKLESMQARRRPILVLVHGTGDTEGLHAAGSAPERWWQAESEFDTWLRSRLETFAGEQLDQVVTRFIWSGLNSEQARESAADQLSAELKRLSEEKRSIHLLSHSHGGNVVRVALENIWVNSPEILPSIRSVTSFGTPFFHYSFSASFLNLAKSVAALGVVAAALAMISLIVVPPASYFPVWVFKLIGFAFGALYLLDFIRSLLDLNIFRRPFEKYLSKEIEWQNFCSSRDEAVALLMAFNRRVHVMRGRSPTRWRSGPLGCSFSLLALIAAGAVFADVAGFDGAVGFGGAAARAIAIVAAFFAIPTIVLLALDYGIDATLTSRLRVIVWGNDVWNGISGVERYPWRGAERTVRKLPEELDKAIESYISERTHELWSRLRAATAPDVPLFSQDFRTIVDSVVAGDELSHTVYYRVEAFADLVAETLGATGDWVLRKR